MARRNANNSDDEDEQEESTDEEGETVTMPPMTLLAGKGKNEKNASNLMKGLITCLSVAETVLREASGTRGPIK
jgi:hypothetical protein